MGPNVHHLLGHNFDSTFAWFCGENKALIKTWAKLGHQTNPTAHIYIYIDIDRETEIETESQRNRETERLRHRQRDR